MTSTRCITLLLGLLATLVSVQPVSAQSELEDALANLYATCLFEPVDNNPFSQAATLARQALAPGINNFIESNLAAIPLAPPSLDAEYAGGEIISVVTGFTPIFTESSATIGQGQFLVGSNVSYFNLSKIRGENLSDLGFAFEQNGGGDLITVQMPFDMNASVFTLYGSYGITNRLDIGVALPVVRLSTENVNTTFRVEGNNTNCRYAETLNCHGNGVREVSPPLNLLGDVPESEVFVETVAVRAKYRFPTSLTTGRLAAVLDLRVPTRGEGTTLGSGHFGMRLTMIGEYDQLGTFKPYVNLGLRAWNGDNSNSVNIATGFNQQLAPNLFFAFDLLGEIDLEGDPFLGPIDDALASDPSSTAFALASSTIPSVDRDHTLNTALGLQVAISPTFHAYGSALFSLLDRGLQSSIAPTIGATAYF